MPPDEDFFGGDEDGLKLRLEPETNRKQTARDGGNDKAEAPTYQRVSFTKVRYQATRGWLQLGL